MKKLVIDARLYRFLMVGGLNTVFGYSLFALFIFLGVTYPFAVLLATLLGVLFNFKTIGKLVFGHAGHSRLIHFITVYIVIYVLNVSGLWLFELIGVYDKYIAGAILLAPLAVISFVLNKKYVFTKI